MSQAPPAAAPPRFSWHRSDLESRMGLRGGRFTGINNLPWMIAGGVLTALFYLALIPFPDHHIVQVFTDRGPVQYVEVFFTFWALCILLVKWTKRRVQARALEFRELVPVEADFVLSPATVGEVLGRLRHACDDPTRYILFSRIELALSNLKNMGQIGDVDGVLRSQAENDEDVMESSYSLVKGLIWAIPVLGFIGTVQGLGIAMGSFGKVLNEASELGQLKTALHGVTGGLSTAFDTTFVALVAALALQLLLVMTRKGEEDLLDECKDYCQRHIVGRLRMTPFDRAE